MWKDLGLASKMAKSQHYLDSTLSIDGPQDRRKVTHWSFQ